MVGETLGKTLHDFDQALCDEVVDNVVSHLGKQRFRAGFQQEISGPLLAHLLECRARAFPEDPLGEIDRDDPPKLLLSGPEINSLASACQWCEGAVPNRVLRWDWDSNPLVYRGYINCLAEIRKKLAEKVAEKWAEDSVVYAERLEKDRVRLHEGIGVVAEWVKDLRFLLHAMEASHFLPAPKGPLPTPTRAGSTAARKPAADPEAVEIMRKAIAKHQKANAGPANERGKNAKVDELLKLAGIRPQRGRDALRWLEAQGEYHGFARDRPTRFRKTL